MGCDGMRWARLGWAGLGWDGMSSLPLVRRLLKEDPNAAVLITASTGLEARLIKHAVCILVRAGFVFV
jgi:hypothetical protein